MLLLATLFAALFGFFAMHGLAQHDVAHGMTSTSAIPVGSQDADHPHAGASVTPIGPDGQPEEAPGHEHGPDGSACVAILVVLAFLLVLAGGPGGPRDLEFVLRPWRSLLLSRGRPPPRPCLIRLSILRC